MLTQYAVRTKLDMIAAEVLRTPGIYYEMYTRQFSNRVQDWMKSVSRPEAILIESVAELDPDYCPHLSRTEFEYSDAELSSHRVSSGPLFNPAWDVQY